MQTEVIRKRVLLALRRLYDAVRRAADAVRRYQAPLPPAEWRAERRRTVEGVELTDRVLVAVRETELEDVYAYLDEPILGRWKKEWDGKGVFVVVLVVTKGGVPCVEMGMRQWLHICVWGYGTDVSKSNEFAAAIANMSDPEFAAAVIGKVEEAAAAIRGWCERREEEAAKRVKQAAKLLEGWAAEVAVEELAGGDDG